MYVKMKSSTSCQKNKKSTSLQRWLYLPPVLHYLQSTPLFLLPRHLLTSPQLQWRRIGCSHDCSDVIQLPFCCRNLHCRCMCEFSPPWRHLSVSRGTSAECLQRQWYWEIMSSQLKVCRQNWKYVVTTESMSESMSYQLKVCRHNWKYVVTTLLYGLKLYVDPHSPAPPESKTGERIESPSFCKRWLHKLKSLFCLLSIKAWFDETLILYSEPVWPSGKALGW